MEGGQMRPCYQLFKALCLTVSILFLVNCAVTQKGAEILEKTGKITSEDKELITKTSEAVRSSFRDLSEEEEYYIGRSVAALILSKYKVWDNSKATNYVNLLTQAVALFSDRPEIYAGYHTLILDTDEINALAAPGGFIFLTRGLLRLCSDEDTLAGIIAHEIGHISARHGLQAIKKSRLIEAFKLLASETAERLAPERLAQLTNLFEGTLDDIVGQLIERGYDRRSEYEADSLSLATLQRAAYSPQGMLHFLEVLAQTKTKTTSLKGWFSTHPEPKDRHERLKAEVSLAKEQVIIPKVRSSRFQKVASTWQ
jgi:predicted Zn-dependent protease